MAASSDDAINTRIRGYPQLAAQISLRPELSQFRTFSFLNAQNLLYLQAELSYLETKLLDVQKEDSASSQGKKAQYAVNWYWFSQCSEDGDTRQWTVAQRIRTVLKEYNEALIQQSQILKFQPPAPPDIKYMQNFLHADHLGALALTGHDSGTWGVYGEKNSCAADLITLCPRPTSDYFSSFLAKRAVGPLLGCGGLRFRKPSAVHGEVVVRHQTVLNFSYCVANVLAAIMPVLSIVVLYRVREMSARLGTIAGFNVMTAICMSVFAKARRAEIFAVAAGFAAVQVVFVASDKMGCSNQCTAG